MATHSALVSAVQPATPSSPSRPLTREGKVHRTRMQARLYTTLETLKSSQHGAKTTTRQKDVRTEVIPEVPSTVVDVIKRVICGDAWSDYDTSREGLLTKMQPDKQTNYLTDELAQGARELKTSEREKIETVFKEVARTVSGVDEKSKDFKWSQVSLPWADFVRHWRDKLSSAHIHRLAAYFGFSKAKLRAAVYVERMGLLLTCPAEKRMKVVFSLLDINGDSVIGPRDVFAALSRRNAPDEPEQAPNEDDPSSKSIKAVFENHGTLGLDFHDAETSFLEIAGVVADSSAQHQGLHIGDVLVRINEVRVEKLTAQEVRQMLQRPERPMSLLFVRQEKKRGPGVGLIPQAVFQHMLRAMQTRERLSTKLKVTIMYARGLRNVGGINGGKSDPYVACEVDKKPHVGFTTKVISSSLDPEWNEEHEVTNYLAGDTLRFTVRDKDIGSKVDEQLGTVALAASKFLDKEFEQELTLTNTGGSKGAKSTLRIKIVNLGEGGIPFDDFAAMFSGQEDVPFFSALVEELTGINPASVQSCSSKVPGLAKVRVTIVSATGLRNTEAKADPYCVAEIPGKSGSRVYTQVLQDTNDPVWNKKFDMEFAKGDILKFVVLHKDSGSERNHEPLGQFTLTSWQVLHGFDGECELMDAGRGSSPKIKIKIEVKKPAPGASPNTAESPGQPRVSADVDPSLVLRREDELRDIQKMPQRSSENGPWYIRSFEALCDQDFLLRRPAFEAAALQLLGMPTTLLASRFFDILDKESKREITLRQWVIMLDRFFGPSWEPSQQRVALSFQVYDLDGDGIVSIRDAVILAGEVERLAGILGHPPEGPSTPICEEMRLLYGKVAETTDLTSGQTVLLDAFCFKGMQPKPVMYDSLLEGLRQIGRPQTPRSAPPTTGILDLVAGEWDTTTGDSTFHGLRIESEGRCFLDDGKQENVVRPVPGHDRKIGLCRMKRKVAQDYVFELDEDGSRMSGQCLQTSAHWVLTRVVAK